jgi:HAD superfamily hydrolase (TIGR01509 family)
MTAIKAIIFDYFGVISSDEYWRFIQQDRRNDPSFKGYSDAVNSGKVSWQEFVTKVANAIGSPVEKVEAMYEAEHMNPLVIGFIHELRTKYKIGLISNASNDFLDAELTRHHIAELFDTVVISSELGFIKPDPRIYEYALQQMDIAADEAIFIDDIARNADAASERGMHGVVYQDFAQMKRDVSALLANTDH